MFSVSLAVGLVASLRALPGALTRGAAEPAVQLPVIVGSSESPSRLVLAGVFLEEPAPRAFPRAVLEGIRDRSLDGEVIPMHVEHAPGRVFLRTTRAYFRRAQERARLVSGRFFDDNEVGTAVVGSAVAAHDRLGIGSKLTAGSFANPVTVVGVLATTGTVFDRTVFAPLPPELSQLSMIAVVPGPGFDLDGLRLRMRGMLLNVVEVDPTLRRLVRLVAAVDEIVDWLSSAIAALSAALVLATFYSSMRERVRDLAVLRIVGARKRTLLLVLLLEALFIGAAGGALGLLVARLLLAVATDVLSGAGYAFRAELGRDALWVAAAAAVGVLLVGAGVGRSVYRIDPVTGLSGVHRPWSEVMSLTARRRLRRSFFILFVFTVAFLPSAVHRPSPRSRLPSSDSFRLFNLLERWDGNGQPPPEIARLDGTVIEIEGYQYQPAGPDSGRTGWRRTFLLVAHDHNMPVELFHEEHRPERSERIRVELEEAIESTLYPVHVRGTFRVSGSADALYRLEDAVARVLVLPSE